MTLGEALKRASFCLQKAGVTEPRQEAEILLARLMQTDRLQLFLEQSTLISPEQFNRYLAAVKRRCRGEPVAYINEEKYFYGYRFYVNNNVLIPRPESELLIDSALDWARGRKNSGGKEIKCIDLGTGSGVLAVTLAIRLPAAEVWAVDISESALRVACYNATLHKVAEKVRFYRGNYFLALENLPEKPKFNLVIANPPYVANRELETLPTAVKQYEPLEALAGGEDGLDGYREIIRQVPRFARDEFLLIMEAGAGQKEKIEELLAGAGIFHMVTWRYDLSGWPRVVEASSKIAG